MRVLVVGSGGREHALAWKLAHEADVLCAPGNPGIAQDVECLPVAASDTSGLIALASARAVDLVVVGPEDPLVAGLADALRDAGVPTFGPGAQAAQLEGSKAFSKALMAEADVPTAEFSTFHDPQEAKSYARLRFADGRPVVVKASGNALGKGVIMCDTERQAEAAIDRMMVERAFGAAGAVIVVEDRVDGREFSLLTLVGDDHIRSLPVAQDYKRAHDGDRGLNTGGMGTLTPAKWVTDDLVAEAEDRIVRPILAKLRDRGISYRGVLFSGIMAHGSRMHCLEYNVRFGDPEIQSVVLRLRQGFGEALMRAALGQPIPPPEVVPNTAVTVVVAGAGYPGPVAKGLPITLGPMPMGVKVFHAGTAMEDGRLVTAGGRVVGVSASAARLQDARRLAYAGAEAVKFDGAYFRRDIALNER